MDTDFVKSLIQTALWRAYKDTGDEIYKKLYEKWYNHYECIMIIGLDN